MGKFALLRYLSEFPTTGFVVETTENSKSNHVRTQGTFKIDSTAIILPFAYFMSPETVAATEALRERQRTSGGKERATKRRSDHAL